MRITVLDNDKSLLQSLGIILRRQGHEVQCFTDPEDVLTNLATTVNPDVIFVDLVMPRMTGLEFLASASPRLPAHCRKAIITGHAEQLNDAELASAGVDALFPKPLDLADIRKFVEQVPENHLLNTFSRGPRTSRVTRNALNH